MKKFIYICGLMSLFVAAGCIGGTFLYRKDHSGIVAQARSSEINQAQGNKSANDSKVNSGNNNSKGNKTVHDGPLYPKEVFLTFDDGPSANTVKILNILDENNVKATFFLVGKNVDNHPDLVRQEYNDGMSVENHSYTHDYAMYKSVQATLDDFNRCNASIKNAIGIEPFHFIRFPGGSDNRVSKSKTMSDIRNAVITSGKEYVDWNTSSTDAASAVVPADVIKSNLFKQLASKKLAVILMHDAPEKTTTVDALPDVIAYLKNQGFVFRTFDDLTPTEETKMISAGIMDRGASKAK